MSEKIPSSPSGPRPRKRATLRTISELTGLSQSTVSLSLRGGATLKEETRNRVAEAAAQIGYVPDRAGVRLRTGKTNVIALVLDSANDSIDFTRHLIQGVGDAIRPTFYHLTVTPEFQRERSVETVRYILENRTADGIIMTHTSARDPRVQLLMERDFPFVTHGRTELNTPHPFHDFHSETFTELAVARLVSKGCRSMSLVISGDNTNNYHTIVSTFERAVAHHQVKGTVMGHKSTRVIAAEMRHYGRDLARSPVRPDGIICDSEIRGICIITGLLDGGVEPGRDIQFLCKQTSDLLSTLYPSIDTIEEDVIAAGGELARLLIRRINGEPARALQTLGEPLAHWR